MKITILIIVSAVIGVTVGVGSIWLGIPQSEPAKFFISFIVLGCTLLVIVGGLSIVIANTISFCKNEFEKFKKAK